MKNRSRLPSKLKLEKERKKTVKNRGKSQKWIPKWEPRRGHFLVIWFFFPCQTALGVQMAPKPPPRAPKASPSLDFHRFLVDFKRFVDDFLYHVGYFLSGLPHYFFGYLELSFSNFWPQVQMCWGRP